MGEATRKQVAEELGSSTGGPFGGWKARGRAFTLIELLVVIAIIANYWPNLFHCPALGQNNRNYGKTWTWRFDVDYAGYGYNGWFLGHHPHQSPEMVEAAGQLYLSLAANES